MDLSAFYQSIIDKLHSIPPEDSQQEYLQIRATFRELFLKAEIPREFPEDFERLQLAYALTVYSTYMFPGGIVHRQMPTVAFDEFVNALQTAYAIGRREGYSEKGLEILLDLD